MMSLWDALRMNMMISYQELVRTFPRDDDHSIKYFLYAFPLIIGEQDTKVLGDVEDYFKAIITHYRPSYRQIERMLSIFAIFVNTAPKMIDSLQCISLAPIICYIKSCRRDVLGFINDRDSDRVLSALNITNNDGSAYAVTLDHIVDLIKYDLGDRGVKLTLAIGLKLVFFIYYVIM